MINFTSEQLAILANRHGSEFYYLVQVNWPDSTVAIYGQYAEPSIAPLLMSCTDLTSQGRVDGFGSVTQVSVELNDAFGMFRNLFDNYDLYNTPVKVYIRDRNSSLSILAFVGRIKENISWSEGTRSLKFDAVTSITNETVGYTPDMSDVQASEKSGMAIHQFTDYTTMPTSYSENSFISSEFFRTQHMLNNKSWPNVFGGALGIPIEPLAHSPITRSTKEVWDLTGGNALIRDAMLLNEQATINNNIRNEIIATQNMGYWKDITPPDEMPLIDIQTLPPPTNTIQIPVAEPELFDGINKLLLELMFDQQSIICQGTFHNSNLGKYLEIELDEFNYPIYQDITVFPSMNSNDYPLPQDLPTPLTDEEKLDIVARSFEARTLERLPNYLADQSNESAKQDAITYGMEAFTKFFICGATKGGTFIPVVGGDYPWLENTWIEVEVQLPDQRTPLDESNGSGPVQWSDPPYTNIGYTFLQVVDQRGFECTVKNPQGFVFTKIKAVYKNNLHQKTAEEISISAQAIIDQEAGAKKGVIPAGTEIRMFNWLPEQQYVVDCKVDSEVLAVLYIDKHNQYIALPPESYYVYNAKPGELWSGYHPACRVVLLSYNSMIRCRTNTGASRGNDAEGGGNLLAHVRNQYNTDEDIASIAVQLVNERPQSTAYMPLSFRRSNDVSAPRPNFCVRLQETSIAQFISDLARQNGKLVRNTGSTISFIDFMHEQPSTFEFNESNVITQSITFDLTKTVQTMFELTFNFNDSLRKAIQFFRKANIPKYGQFKEQWTFDVYPDYRDGLEVAEFWMFYYSNVWRTATLKATFEALGVDIFDTVTLNIVTPLKFTDAYEEVVGDQVTNPTTTERTEELGRGGWITYRNQYPIYNTVALVTDKSINIETGTIVFKLWLPILAGETTKCSTLWER